MMPHTKFFKFFKIVAFFSLVGLIALAVPGFAQNPPIPPVEGPAEEPANTFMERTISGAPKTACPETLAPKLQAKREEFGAFIDQHFKSKKNNSDLVPAAIERFRQYAREVKEAAQVVFDEKGTIPDEVRDPGACQQKVNDELFLVKEILRKHILATSHAKKTTKLLDAYKEINSKLERLNTEMSQMYGYMEVFSTKVPCYAEKCN